ncbi:DUF3329 domain-containing protein [Maritimibacter dapengensis]|uniref:DUF3329 domain-containing protein n=1 Tax=Maritimibacter dapengensis TaxID=2836868 RepID=A0ABS6SZY7_9RHOB|nr:DUF3329 domain-containing protein [Maritimibacter dapengensis]MBV7378522.1 DUF3329 domain-containing protein [Maritimibacter dapengensis]
MFDLQVPFFRPLWLRLVTVAVALGWAVFEVVTGSVGFAMIFAALGLYAAWQFFVVWDPKDDDNQRNDDG